MCIGKIDLPPTPTSATGTLLSEVSETKRHNTRRNTERAPARHLGSFRRELLLYLAIREAHVRKYSEWRSVPKQGLYWKPQDALLPEVEFTRTLTVKISSALRALEELGYVRRTRPGEDYSRTTHVKVTRSGVLEAMQIIDRQGQSKDAARRQQGGSYWQTLTPEGLVDAAAEILQAMKEHGLFPVPQQLPDARKLVIALRAHCRAHPDDQRASNILPELEERIPVYRPTQEATDRYLNMIAESFAQIRWKTKRSIYHEEPWMLEVATFDLSMGMEPMEL